MFRKNIFVFLMVFALQFPYILQWEHYIAISHLSNQKNSKYNLTNGNYSHCYFKHKAPYSSYNYTETFFSLAISMEEFIQPTFPTKNKESFLPLSFLLRAPPFFHFL